MHYRVEHQHDWDIYAQRLTSLYNMQVNRAISSLLLGLALSRKPFGPDNI